MTQPPPALTQHPQFTAEHWQKAPRETHKATIERVTNLGDDHVEIVLKNGPRFRRRKAEIKQLLTANLDIEVETFKNQLVTGLFVPGVGWAFRMTAQELADYAKELMVAQHNQQREAMEAMLSFVASTLVDYLVECGGHTEQRDLDNGATIDLVVPAAVQINPRHMAAALLTAIENGPQ